MSWTNEKFYSFPPFSCILKVIRKIIADQATGILVVPDWATQTWYPLLLGILEQPPIILKRSVELLIIAFTTKHEAPITQEPEISYLSCIRETLQVTGLYMDTIDIIVSSWREGTKSQYQSYAKKWFEFCKTNKCHITSPPLLLAMQFLSDMYHAGLSYSSINTARSVLSYLLYCENSSIPFGQLPIVKRFMKGIFELRPSLPKYSATWGVNLAFEYIRKHDLLLLKLKDLSYRMAFLLCLLSGQRCQTVSKLFLDNMVVNEDKVTFLITKKLKHTRIGSHQKPLEFMAFPRDKRLCTLRVQKYGNDGLKHDGKDVLWPMNLVTKGRFSLQSRPQFKLLWRENIHHLVFCLSDRQRQSLEKLFLNFETKTSK